MSSPFQYFLWRVTYEGLADLALRVPKEVVPAMRQGDPKALFGLPDGQRLEIQQADRGRSVGKVGVTDVVARRR